jgi:2-hydroxy-6-oxonona-2,4-dienedioate hydrolase
VFVDDAKFYFYPPRRGLPSVVLLPGLVAGRWMWHSTIEMLAANGYGCLALTEPLAIRHQQIASLTYEVLGLMDRCGIDSAVLAGGSFGSLIALECAIQSPQRIELLVLSGAPGTITREQLGITFHGKLTRRIAHTVVDRLFFDASCVSEQTLSMSLDLFRDLRRLVNMGRLMKESDSYDYATALSKISAFVLMVWGIQDQISPCVVWERLALSASNGAFFTVDRCGHTPMIERPHAFNSLLLDHLRAVRVATL